jgi:4-amino-4-deoxy-L-arabinose transferase-like glycosyltransferase
MRFYSIIAACILTFALLSQWLRLPLSFQGVWMSPDETANSLSAVFFADHGTFRIPSSITKDLPWIFPRSFVPMIDDGVVVLVGFLGMPLVLALVYKLIGIYGILFFSAFFATITLWALWRCLPKDWPGGIKWIVLLVWISFPTVIIYANRGSFSNLFITCLAVWLWWLLAEAKGKWSWPVAGAVLGLACMTRPTEVVWLLPLAFFAIFYRRSPSLRVKEGWKEYSLMIVAFLAIVGVGAYLGHQTYGSWFLSGYQIRPDFNQYALSPGGQGSVSVIKALPFSIHPRAILWNAYHYLGGVLWPWLLAVLLAGYFCFKEKIWRKSERWIIAAFGWTSAWLVAFYGNGVYQDHVGVNVASMGNSYLRYLLPLSVLAAVATGYAVIRLWKFWSLRFLALAMVLALVVVGQWSALARDDEGMLANQIELSRYALIRDQARSMLEPNTIVLSDRSDKIFFPVFSAASPIPEDRIIQGIKDAGYKLALFLPTQKAEDEQAWSDRGFKLKFLFTNGNQSLYHLE